MWRNRKQLAGDGHGVRFVDRGEHELKGFSETHRLYEVQPNLAGTE